MSGISSCRTSRPGSSSCCTACARRTGISGRSLCLSLRLRPPRDRRGVVPGDMCIVIASITRMPAASIGLSIAAREFGVGKLSAFTLGYQPYVWSAAEANWRTPALQDLVFYEVNIAKLGGNLERTRELMAYLNDLVVNAIEVMPLSNVASSIPIGYFGVGGRFGTEC